MPNEPREVTELRRLGPVVKSWTPRTGNVEINAAGAILSLLDYVDRLESRITHLENGTQP